MIYDSLNYRRLRIAQSQLISPHGDSTRGLKMPNLNGPIMYVKVFGGVPDTISNAA